tara:strand:+ start:186 stop:440 length:255 start_codon:yes stop_codon:yes gene_type:complete
MDKLLNVHHDYKFHAEIMYETGDSFGFIDAMGNTLEEFIDDINSRFDKYKDRQPHLAEAISDPNGEKIDITYKIRTILKKRGIA